MNRMDRIDRSPVLDASGKGGGDGAAVPVPGDAGDAGTTIAAAPPADRPGSVAVIRGNGYLPTDAEKITGTAPSALPAGRSGDTGLTGWTSSAGFTVESAIRAAHDPAAPAAAVS